MADPKDPVLQNTIVPDDLITPEEFQASEQEVDTTESTLTDSDLEELSEEYTLDQKYGDKGGTAFATAAASGLSFGVSDQLLTKLGLFSQEELRNIRERNQFESISGEVLGTVGGLLATGGTGAAAKGAATAGKAVQTVAKASLATEKITAKALNKIIAETGQKKFAKDVIKKSIPLAAGSSVEGAAYSAGQLVKEDALGTAEFNAENLVTSIGGGALIGGAFGAGIGASLPLFAKAGSVGRQGLKIGKSKLDDLKDPITAGRELVGLSAARAAKDPKLAEDLVPYLKDEVKLGKSTSTEQIETAVERLNQEAAEGIPRVLNKIDEIAASNPQILTDRTVVDDIIRHIDEEYLSKFGADKAFSEKMAPIRKYRQDLINIRFGDGPLNANELQLLRKKADELAMFNKLENPSQMNLVARHARRVFRAEIDNLATRAESIGGEAATVAQELKRFNKNAHIGLKIIDSLRKKNLKGEELFSLSDIIVGGLGGFSFGPEAVALAAANKFAKSDFRRRLAVLSFVEKQNQKVAKTVSKSVKDFFTKPAKAAGTAAKVSLVKSMLSEKLVNGKKESAKDEQQAFRNIKSNITELANNPEKLEKRAITSVAGLATVAPGTAEAAQQVLSRAVFFLNSKLPEQVQSVDDLKALYRERELSDLELSKFKSYVNAIENPMLLLEDLQAGTATAEQVDAVKTVYPDLYRRIVEETYTYITENKDRIAYNKRVQLGTLLGIPTDSSLRPDALADLQSNFGKAGEGEDPQQQGGSTAAQGQAPGRLSVTGLREMDIAARENSEAQNFISRKRN